MLIHALCECIVLDSARNSADRDSSGSFAGAVTGCRCCSLLWLDVNLALKVVGLAWLNRPSRLLRLCSRLPRGRRERASGMSEGYAR